MRVDLAQPKVNIFHKTDPSMERVFTLVNLWYLLHIIFRFQQCVCIVQSISLLTPISIQDEFPYGGAIFVGVFPLPFYIYIYIYHSFIMSLLSSHFVVFDLLIFFNLLRLFLIIATSLPSSLRCPFLQT
jgi:hypothetical protein